MAAVARDDEDFGALGNDLGRVRGSAGRQINSGVSLHRRFRSADDSGPARRGLPDQFLSSRQIVFLVIESRVHLDQADPNSFIGLRIG